jgi:LacI family transcriptional regulator, galactose operon repressor
MAAPRSARSRPQATAPTLRDVARAAGVSTASASRAMAGQVGVSAELHARILAAATRLGYHANLAARALVSRRSGLVGVIVGTLVDPLLAGIVEGLERALADAGYGTLLATTGGSPGQSLPVTQSLVGRGAEAFVFAGAGPLPEEIDVMTAHGLPWAAVSDAPEAGSLATDTGRRRGALLAARYLLDLGHRRFGVIARAGAATREGVEAALALAESNAQFLHPHRAGPEEPDAARIATRRLLDQDEPPTAMVCGSDAEALAAVRECSMRRIAVPREVSIIGFGDWEFARHAQPALTTLRVSLAAIGMRSVEALLANLRGETPRPSEAPIKLVVRETTAPAPP